MSLITSASPQSIHLGTDDKSGMIVTPEREPIPQHLPKFYLFTEKGPTEPMLVGGARMLALYGANSFNKLNPHYNHATLFATAIAGEANTLMVQRVVPDDANPEANFTLYVDVLEDTIPNYKRNSDGSIVTDLTGNPVPDTDKPTIDGFKIKYIKEYTPAGLVLGSKTLKTGNMIGSDGTTTSTMFPILDFKARYKGEFYNNVGIAIESMPQATIPSTIISEAKILPYKLRLVQRESKKATAVVQKSLYGEASVMFSLKENAINPTTEAGFDIDAIFPEQWSNEDNPLMPLKYSDYENVHCYYSNVSDLLALFMSKEADYVSNVSVEWANGMYASTLSWFDFTTDNNELLLEQETHLIDLFSGKSSKGVNYFTIRYEDDNFVSTSTMKESQISANTPLFLEGGSNGTLDNENFETLVVREMQKYLDPDSEVMDMAVNVESIIYDSGFTLPTKKELCNFIGLRKDTMIVLTTHDAELGTKSLPLSDERSIAVNLKTRLKLTPESDYFGTKVMRGLVIGGTALLSDGSKKERVPQSLEIAVKSAAYMGAGNGEWKAVKKFDRAPGSIVTNLVDLQPAFIPAGVKPVLWNTGMVWSQPFDRRQFFFPALQTVYDDDTSVLNSYFTVMAICTLNKVAAEAWRNFTGSSDLTRAQLADAVVAFVNGRIANKFDGRFVIVPEVEFTEADLQRGYSWNLAIKIYANNMKSVMVSRIVSFRMDK